MLFGVLSFVGGCKSSTEKSKKDPFSLQNLACVWEADTVGYLCHQQQLWPNNLNLVALFEANQNPANNVGQSHVFAQVMELLVPEDTGAMV